MPTFVLDIPSAPPTSCPGSACGNAFVGGERVLLAEECASLPAGYRALSAELAWSLLWSASASFVQGKFEGLNAESGSWEPVSDPSLNVNITPSQLRRLRVEPPAGDR